MRGRSLAREIALKIAYQTDLRGEGKLADADVLIRELGCGSGPADFARQLTQGWWEHREAIDERLSGALENWTLDRAAVVERSILRLAAYELIYLTDTPQRVVLNEAVELAKKFGSRESASFVNGVLDRIAGDASAGEPA